MVCSEPRVHDAPRVHDPTSSVNERMNKDFFVSTRRASRPLPYLRLFRDFIAPKSQRCGESHLAEQSPHLRISNLDLQCQLAESSPRSSQPQLETT